MLNQERSKRDEVPLRNESAVVCRGNHFGRRHSRRTKLASECLGDAPEKETGGKCKRRIKS